MLSLLKLLTNESFPIYSENDSERRLLFEFEGFSIRIVFIEMEDCDAFETCFDEDRQFFDFNNFLKYHKISSVLLTNTYVFSEEEDDDNDASASNWSFYLEMFDVVRQLNKVNAKYILSYVVEDRIYDDCGWNMGCPVTIEYGWFITINEEFWNQDSIISIIGCLKKAQTFNHYWLKNNSEKETELEARIISTNTKARRLGYIKLFLSSFKNRYKQSLQSFHNWLYEELDIAESELIEYKNNRGSIKKQGNNLNTKPYLDVAIDLGILIKRDSSLELSKYGKVYLELFQQYSKCENMFKMDIVDKSMFLESIMMNDYLYMSVILEYAYICPTPSYKELKLNFQAYVLKKIRDIRNSAGLTSFNKLIKLNSLEKRISCWSKAEVYLEHVLMPRLNWLYDLEIIHLNKNLSFSITESGKRLYAHIAYCCDINKSYICMPQHYFQNNYMSMFCDIYDIPAKYGNNEAKGYYDKYLSECINKFRTIVPNRVTYSNFVTYCKRKFLIDHNLIVEENAINTYLKSEPQKYIFKYQHYYKDGYIQKK